MVRKGWKLEVRNTGRNEQKSKVGIGVNCEAGTLLEYCSMLDYTASTTTGTGEADKWRVVSQ
jgi:hypothetical protein